ncbi:MAG: Calvin cycle protein CP12 [Cyanobacteria bacterium P01_E01_bin.6]
MVQSIRKFIRPKASPSFATDQPKSLELQIQEARDYARMITDISGVSSSEAAVAWDIVEELMAARADRQYKIKNTFEDYCSAYPDAPEARIYEI